MKNKKIKAFILLTGLSILCFVSCKTKQLPPKNIPVIEETAFIQVTDKSQMSYRGLSCTVTFSDGTIREYKTDDEGKITVKANSDLIIVKIVYDFTGYKRTGGKLLAKEDFKLAKKVKTKLNSKLQEFELNFSPFAGAKTILILDIF
ncbi:hypothetical protein [Treponema pedis]|uniref:hypothetical protein n=1 Tax=Treponema pedis TaxID=409322 RepID=UPI0003F80982|nr:hypothetical protein [Treponema pedis]QSI04708.1 hypothetical protein DYQ05_07030 [Treponema pedis]